MTFLHTIPSPRVLIKYGLQINSLIYITPATAWRNVSRIPTTSSSGSAKRCGFYSALSTRLCYERIDSSYLVEEETLSIYKAKHYYPVKLEDVYNDRYKVIGKLGFGSASTVWLCRDLKEQHDYVALKVYINSAKVHRELPIYEELIGLPSEHYGRKYIREMYDSFEMRGPHGTHICLVHQPLGISLNELKDLTSNGVFESDLIRQSMRCILTGIQFLHKELQIIHTGKS
jgi:serine/threonine-protein kinase SRPK3